MFGVRNIMENSQAPKITKYYDFALRLIDDDLFWNKSKKCLSTEPTTTWKTFDGVKKIIGVAEAEVPGSNFIPLRILNTVSLPDTADMVFLPYVKQPKVSYVLFDRDLGKYLINREHRRTCDNPKYAKKFNSVLLAQRYLDDTSDPDKYVIYKITQHY